MHPTTVQGQSTPKASAENDKAIVIEDSDDEDDIVLVVDDDLT